VGEGKGRGLLLRGWKGGRPKGGDRGRSLSTISQRVGPIPEPSTMLEVMGCGSENLPSEVLQT